MVSSSPLSAFLGKPNLDTIREETQKKVIDRDPNTVVTYIGESGTLLPGIVIVKTAAGDAFYASSESLDRMRRDRLLSAKSALSSLSLIDESSVPSIRDRLVHYLESTVTSFSNDATQNSSVAMYVDTQIEMAQLSYRRLRGNEVGYSVANDEFNQALVEVGLDSAAAQTNEYVQGSTPVLG